VSVLHSEVTRLKTALAANAGDEQLMRIILDNKDADLTLVEDLRRRLAYVLPLVVHATALTLPGSESDVRLQAFRQVLEKLDQSSPDTAQHARAEAEARQQLADATKELDRWRTTFGHATDLPPDAAQLAKQLRAKEDELAKARLQVTQHSQVCLLHVISTIAYSYAFDRRKLLYIPSSTSSLLHGRRSINRSRTRCSS
jgi:E3 ubiquitin-protein ligase BRE1